MGSGLTSPPRVSQPSWARTRVDAAALASMMDCGIDEAVARHLLKKHNNHVQNAMNAALGMTDAQREAIAAQAQSQGRAK